MPYNFLQLCERASHVLPFSEEQKEAIKKSEQLVNHYERAYSQADHAGRRLIALEVFKTYPFAHDLWFVQQELNKCLQLGRPEFFDEILSGPGQRYEENKYIMALKQVAVYHYVDDLIRRGLTLTEAFNWLSEHKKIFGTYLSVANTQKLYYCGKKQQIFFYVSDTKDEFIVKWGPVMVIMKDGRYFGYIEYKLPKN